MALKRKTRNSSWYILFFVWPFAVLIKSLTKLKNPHTKNIVWFFTAFFGLTFVIHSDGLDAFRYAQEFERIASNNLSFSEIFKLQIFDGKSLDFYKTLMIFGVSRVSESFKVYFFFIALIYGYFYSRNFWSVVSLIKGNLSEYQILLSYVFLFIIPFQDFQFVRFTTAAHIFFFGSFPYLTGGGKQRIIWIFTSMLVHFSFFIPITIFLIHLLLPKKTTLFFIFYIISVFFVELNLASINNFLALNAPDILQDKVTAYGREEFAEEVAETFSAVNWYIRYYHVAIDYAIVLLLSSIYLLRNKLLVKDSNLKNLISFTLLFTAFANLIVAFPSGFRFIVISRLFAVALIILSSNFLSNFVAYRVSKRISVPLFLFFLIISFRYFIDLAGISTFFGNSISVLISSDERTLIDFIKRLFY